MHFKNTHTIKSIYIIFHQNFDVNNFSLEEREYFTSKICCRIYLDSKANINFDVQ